jgi:hypothetical protein
MSAIITAPMPRLTDHLRFRSDGLALARGLVRVDRAVGPRHGLGGAARRGPRSRRRARAAEIVGVAERRIERDPGPLGGEVDGRR